MTAATKSYLIMTLIGPFLIAGVAILPGLLAQRQATAVHEGQIAVVGGSGELFDAFAAELESSPLTAVRYESEYLARAAVEDETVAGILLIPDDYRDASAIRYISRSGTDTQVAATLEATFGNAVIRGRIADAGLDPNEVAALTQRPSIRLQRLSSGVEGEADDGFTMLLTALVFVMLIYMTVILYGQMIGRSVLTEKLVNTKEILLSSVRSRDLLFGKIFGKGVAGLLQYAVWIGIALVLVAVVGPALEISMPSGLTTANLGYLLLFFFLAFFLYAAGYAAVGAASRDEQQFGQLSMPLIVFLIVPLFLVSPIVMNPGGTLTLILSYFPFTSPVIMLLRIMVDTPPMWEVAASIAILIAAIAAAGLAAARVFRVGILRSGIPGSWRQMFSWLRQ